MAEYRDGVQDVTCYISYLLAYLQRVSENVDAGRVWQSEVDGLLRVLLTSRNESVMRAQHQVSDLRSALRKIEHRLDVYSGQSPDSPASDYKPQLMREPLSQQQQVGWRHCVARMFWSPR